MKKLVAFALILSLGMFSVVGCGGPDTKKPVDNKKPVETKAPTDTKAPVDTKTPGK
jgi:hypothetical protein